MAPIAIEGCIGAGKSTVIDILRHMTGASVKPEPVDAWRPFLDKAYRDSTGHVALQAKIMLDTCRTCPHEDIVERSPEWQKVTFLPAMLQAKCISVAEGNMLMDLHSTLIAWKPCLTIFLQCSKDELIKRISRRNRGFESNLPPQYLNSLIAHYQEAPKYFGGTVVIDVTDMSPAAAASAVHKAITDLTPPPSPSMTLEPIADHAKGT